MFTAKSGAPAAPSRKPEISSTTSSKSVRPKLKPAEAPTQPPSAFLASRPISMTSSKPSPTSCRILNSAKRKSTSPRRARKTASHAATTMPAKSRSAKWSGWPTAKITRTRASPNTQPSRPSRARISSTGTRNTFIPTTSFSASPATSTPPPWKPAYAPLSSLGRAANSRRKITSNIPRPSPATTSSPKMM